MIEEIPAQVKTKLILENLSAEECSVNELSDVFSHAQKIQDHLPNIDDVESCKKIVNDSDLNWIFLEDKSQYHSLFWAESETKLFIRCA